MTTQERLLASIPEGDRAEARRFVETGEAGADFLRRLDEDIVLRRTLEAWLRADPIGAVVRAVARGGEG